MLEFLVFHILIYPDCNTWHHLIAYHRLVVASDRNFVIFVRKYLEQFLYRTIHYLHTLILISNNHSHMNGRWLKWDYKNNYAQLTKKYLFEILRFYNLRAYLIMSSAPTFDNFWGHVLNSTTKWIGPLPLGFHIIINNQLDSTRLIYLFIIVKFS